jgi:hypothetical protein
MTEVDRASSSLEGAGLFSVGGEAAPLRAGERVHWPSTLQHCLWTDDSTMTMLMVEHHGEGLAR